MSGLMNDLVNFSLNQFLSEVRESIFLLTLGYFFQWPYSTQKVVVAFDFIPDLFFAFIFSFFR